MTRPDSRGHSRIRHRIAGGAAVVAIAAGIVAVPIASATASAPPTSISSFAASPKLLVPASGRVTFTGSVKNASTCTISVSPPAAGLPVSFSCAGSSSSFGIQFRPPENSTAAPVHYKVTLTAKGTGKSATKTGLFEVESYRWAIVSRPSGSVARLDSTSCATTNLCVAVGASGEAVVLDAQGAHRATVDGTHTLTSVSCAAASPPLCVAVDDAGQFLTYNGAKWSAPASGGGGSGGTAAPAFSSVSCVRESPTVPKLGKRCVASDNAGGAYVLTFPPGLPLVLSPPVPTGLTGRSFTACSSTSSCVIVDVNGDGVFFNGTSFSAPPVSIDPKGHVSAASCASDGTCVVVDGGGGAVPFSLTDSVWKPHVRESPTKIALRSVSCVVGLCVTLASDGSVFQSAASAVYPRHGWDGTIKGKLHASDDVAAVACALDKSTPLLLSCDFVSNGASSKKDFKGHVTLLK